MAKQDVDILRNELLNLLSGGGAHVDFEYSVADLPKKYYGATLPGLPYTLWQVLEHMRIAQHDILDYITNPDYEEPNYPDDYWPKEGSPPSANAWKKSVEQISNDLQQLKDIVMNPKTNLLGAIPHIKNGPPLLREILLVADHNSYHIGQIQLIRSQFGIWKE